MRSESVNSLPSRLSTTAIARDGHIVFALCGDLDQSTALMFQDELDEIVLNCPRDSS